MTRSSFPPSLATFAERAAGARPVDEWNPPYCGDIGLAILFDGTWTYHDSPIRRPAMVKLFAGVLRKDDDGRHYLVTPVEKVDVAVADAPFLAVEMAVEGEGRNRTLTFRTNVDDIVRCGPEHSLRFASGGARNAGAGSQSTVAGGFKPYVLVRGRLEARLTRALALDLAELAMEDEAGLAVWSGGERFELNASE